MVAAVANDPVAELIHRDKEDVIARFDKIIRGEVVSEVLIIWLWLFGVNGLRSKEEKEIIFNFWLYFGLK